MNRREFILQTLVRVGILIYPKCEVDKILDKTSELPDDEFQLYIKFLAKTYKDNL